jgi:hypothetical protein
MTNEVQVEGDQSIMQAGVPQPKDTNAVGMESKEPDIELVLSDDVVGDVM